MANVLIRNLDDDLLLALKARAKANGRSLQAEIHAALRRAQATDLARTRQISDRWRKRTAGRIHGDSVALIRELRDGR